MFFSPLTFAQNSVNVDHLVSSPTTGAKIQKPLFVSLSAESIKEKIKKMSSFSLRESREFALDLVKSDINADLKVQYILQIQELFPDDLGLNQSFIEAIEALPLSEKTSLERTLKGLKLKNLEIIEDVELKGILGEVSLLQHIGLVGRQADALAKLSAFDEKRQKKYQLTLQHVLKNSPAVNLRAKALELLNAFKQEVSPQDAKAALALLVEANGNLELQKKLLAVLLKNPSDKYKLDSVSHAVFLQFISSHDPQLISLTLKVLAKSQGYTIELADKIVSLPTKWPGLFEEEILRALIRGPYEPSVLHTKVSALFPSMSSRFRKILMEEYIAFLPKNLRMQWSALLKDSLDDPDPMIRELTAELLKGSEVSVIGIAPILNYLKRPENKNDVGMGLVLLRNAVSFGGDHELITQAIEKSKSDANQGEAYKLLDHAYSVPYNKDSLKRSLLKEVSSDSKDGKSIDWAQNSILALDKFYASSQEANSFWNTLKAGELSASSKQGREKIFHKAIIDHNVELVRQLIAIDPALSSVFKRIDSLQLAKDHQWELLELLLEKNENYFFRASDMPDVLYAAALDGRFDLFGLLAGRTKKMKGAYSYAFTKTKAVLAGELEALKIIDEQLESISPYDTLLLEDAAQAGHIDVIKYLVEEKGINDSESLHYALYEAAAYGHLDIIKFINQKGLPNTSEVLEEAYVGFQWELVKVLEKQGIKLNNEQLIRLIKHRSLRPSQ